jgi:hypothetical protein
MARQAAREEEERGSFRLLWNVLVWFVFQVPSYAKVLTFAIRNRRAWLYAVPANESWELDDE